MEKLTKKQKNTFITLIVVIIILSVLLLISVFYNLAGGFYFSRIVKFDKILGEKQSILIDREGSFVIASNFAGVVVLGSDIKNEVMIKTNNLANGLYLRAKAEIVGTNSNSLIFGYTNWIYNEEDGYIYYLEELQSNQNLGLCLYVRLNENTPLQSNLNYIFAVVVEASLNEFDYTLNL